MTKFLKLSVLFITINFLYAQYEAFENFDEENTELIDHLKMLEENPLDINTVTREELVIFPFLTESEIDTILKYQPYTTIQDLASYLPGKSFKALSPFITFRESRNIVSGKLTSRMAFCPETMRGYSERVYLGSRYNFYNRIQFSFGENISSGFLSHKDPGESSFADHYSGFIQWRNKRLHLIAGFFSLQYGEGLVFSRSWFSSRGSYPLSPLKSAPWGGKAYLSSTEEAGLNGIYGQAFLTSRITVNGFYSKNILDAVPEQNGLGVTRLVTDGYHRTQTEILRKDLVQKTTTGAALIYHPVPALRIGIVQAWYNYTPDIITDKSEQEYINVWYNQSRITSLFKTFSFRNCIISSEFALSSPGALAHQYGLLFKENNWSAGGKWWHLPNAFSSPEGRAFLNSDCFPRGLEGFYIGLSGRLSADFNVNGYWQCEKDLWRSYYNPMPDERKWYFVQIKWDPGSENELEVHYRYSGTSLSRHVIRLSCKRGISRRFFMKTGVEKVFETLHQKEGINCYQDIQLNILKSFSLQGRYSSFNAIDYDARIYEYESDLPGAYAMSVLHGKGNKGYLILRWNPDKIFSLCLKYRRIYFEGVESIGSGYAEIPGDIRRDIRVQGTFSF